MDQQSRWRWVAAIAIVFGSLSFGQDAQAADKAGCKDPAWLAKRPAGYEISDCDSRQWTSQTLSLPAGDRVLEGQRDTVTYDLTDPSKDIADNAAWRYFADQARRRGATLASDPNGGLLALNSKTTQGEVWYMYQHASGNANSTGSFILTTLRIAPLAQEVQARPDPAPLDISGSSCREPGWLVQQFGYFKFSGCIIRDYDRIDLSLPDGDKTIAGTAVEDDYELTDDSKNPFASAVQRNYVAALQKIGAKLVSDPADMYTAVLTRTDATGEFWYIYRHGSGNEESTGSYSVTTLQTAAFPQVVEAKAEAVATGAAGDCKGPPWLVRQFDYFKLDSCDGQDIGTLTLDLQDGQKVLTGRLIEAHYVLADNRRDPPKFLVHDNFVNALQAIGATLISDPDHPEQVVMSRKTPSGDDWYIYKEAGGSDTATSAYDLISVESGGPPPAACKLEVYGVNFDFNKSTLRPDSEPVLAQLLGMFTADPSYAGEISGHTDNVGTRAYNMKLSAARAAAVKTWLVGHGIATARITTAGYADTRPLVPNTSDENRFKNRRVELTRKACKG